MRIDEVLVSILSTIDDELSLSLVFHGDEDEIDDGTVVFWTPRRATIALNEWKKIKKKFQQFSMKDIESIVNENENKNCSYNE